MLLPLKRAFCVLPSLETGPNHSSDACCKFLALRTYESAFMILHNLDLDLCSCFLRVFCVFCVGPDEGWSYYRQLRPRRDHQRGCPSQGTQLGQGDSLHAENTIVIRRTYEEYEEGEQRECE